MHQLLSSLSHDSVYRHGPSQMPAVHRACSKGLVSLGTDSNGRACWLTLLPLLGAGAGATEG